jgi:sialic acid synthase SpsE
MVKNIRDIPIIIGSGEKKVSENEWITRKKYHVSMVSSVQIPAGTKLTDAMVVYRNPGTGISYKESFKILGKHTIVDIPENELLTIEMFK